MRTSHTFGLQLGLVVASAFVLVAPVAAGGLDHVYIQGVPCSVAIETAKTAWSEKRVQCRSMLAPGGEPGRAYQRYNSCDSDADNLHAVWIQTQRSCYQLDAQVSAWKYSTRQAVAAGGQEALRQGHLGGREFSVLYRRFEAVYAARETARSVLDFFGLPKDTSPSVRYRHIIDSVSSFGDFALPGALPSLMTSLSLTGVRLIAFDVSRQFDQVLARSHGLSDIDAVHSPALPAVWRRTVSADPSQLTELIAFAEQMSTGDMANLNAVAWVNAFLRSANDAKVQAAAAARLQAEQAEASRRQAAQDDARRSAQARARAQAEREAFLLEMEESEREVEAARARIRSQAAPIIPFPIFVPPAPTAVQRSPTYSTPAPAPRPSTGTATTRDRELIRNGR